MTEAETIASLNEIADVIATYAGMWLSFTFGYLTVAYFLGKALSRFQCVTVSVLYGVASAWFGSAAIAHTQAWHLVRTSQDTRYNDIWLMTAETGWEWGISVFLTAGTLVSLYFMHDVRRRKT